MFQFFFFNALRKILEQFSICKLDIVQDLCEYCQIFLSDFLVQNVPMLPSPKCVPGGKNVLTLSSPKISHEENVLITSICILIILVVAFLPLNTSVLPLMLPHNF